MPVPISTVPKKTVENKSKKKHNKTNAHVQTTAHIHLPHSLSTISAISIPRMRPEPLSLRCRCWRPVPRRRAFSSASTPFSTPRCHTHATEGSRKESRPLENARRCGADLRQSNVRRQSEATSGGCRVASRTSGNSDNVTITARDANQDGIGGKICSPCCWLRGWDQSMW